MPITPHNTGFSSALVEEALHSALALPKTPRVLGITGLQGSGKSTLAGQVVSAAQVLGLQAVAISIDDFYLTHAQRQKLAVKIHPLLATRGPPGTHDLELAITTLQSLIQGQVSFIPRFDKLNDDRFAQSQWTPITHKLDLIVFEGWFLATPPQAPQALSQSINALEQQEDANGIWRSYCNNSLKEHYPSLWELIDYLWFLQPPSFEVVYQWRWQQEQHLHAAQPSIPSMTQAQVARFIQHFERISRHCMKQLPIIAQRTIALDQHRQPIANF